MRRLAFIALVACKHGGTAGVTPPVAPRTERALPAAKPGPATHVVSLTPGSPTPILRGPFEVRTINPAGDLELGLAADERCDDANWFSYSGGGVAAADGEVLCARSSARNPVTQGFSGQGFASSNLQAR